MFIMDFWEWIYSAGINIDCVLCIKGIKGNQKPGKAIRREVDVLATVYFLIGRWLFFKMRMRQYTCTYRGYHFGKWCSFGQGALLFSL